MRSLSVACGLILGLLAASPAMGQARQEVSFAQMFLWSESVVGLIIILLLQVMSLVTVALIIRYAMQFRRQKLLPQRVYLRLQTLLTGQQYREAVAFCERDDSFLGALASAAIQEAPSGYPAMQRAIEEAADVQSSHLLRPIEYLNVIGNLSPMLGLFGTIYGMIVAFQELVASGGRPDPGQLAAGISTALVTTFWGLVVAMPALAGYALLRNRLDELGAESLVLAERLIHPFRPAATGPSDGEASDTTE